MDTALTKKTRGVVYLILCLALISGLIQACETATTLPTSTSAPSINLTTLTILTDTPKPAPTVTPTHIPHTTTPTPTSTTTYELLSCPDQPLEVSPGQPVTLLYANDNKVWHWEAASDMKTLLPLPEEAVAPLISPDGKTIAYLQRGQAYDTPKNPVASIPLWLYDRQTGESHLVGSFPTAQTRAYYPESPHIYLKMEWLPDGVRLLVQVYPYPWGVGVLQPAGPLYLVDAAEETNRLLLEGGDYEIYNIRPDGSQIAALDTEAITLTGEWAWERYQEGNLHLISTGPESSRRSLTIRLPNDPWAFMRPVYSPDGKRLAFNSENGLAVVDTASGMIEEIALENTCLAENGCEWTDFLPIYWLPDGKSFYTTQTINDYFDERATTTLSQVFLEPTTLIEAVVTIHANPGTFVFSPNRQILTYWNQPDFDRLKNSEEGLNWITFYLLDLDQGDAVLYTEEYLLRISQWHPGSQRFLYTFSRFGGANPVRNQLAQGEICQPARVLPVPEKAMIDKVEWVDENRFLAWTLPSGGIPDRYQTQLYLYDLAGEGSPKHIADLLQIAFDPYGAGEIYGVQDQVVVLEE
jgi:hypothetical protein